MQATLLNFGDCTRVIRDMGGGPLAIDAGDVLSADVHEAHFRMIAAGVRTDSLMIVPQGVEISGKLKGVVDLLRQARQMTYNEFLNRFNDIVPFDDEDNGLRPSATRMMAALCDIARHEVAMALARVDIREQGDPVTRGEVRAPPKDDTSDGILGNLVGPPPVKPTPPAPKKAKAKIARQRA